MRRSFLITRFAALAVALSLAFPRFVLAFTYDYIAQGYDYEILSNAAGDNMAAAVSADLNGDGIDDIVVGGGADYGHGIAKFNILWGRRDWSRLPHSIDLATTRGALYIQSLLDHEFAWTGFQTYVAAGDFNGDGKDDVVFGGWHNNLGGQRNGAVYLLYGRSRYSPNVINFRPQDFDATFIGGYGGGNLGFAVACGDFNGDGKSDLAALAPYAHAVLCVFGSSSLPTHYQKTLTTATADLAFYGSNIGDQVLAAGDFNGDGRSDLAFGTRSQILIYYCTSALIAQHYINTDVTAPNLRITGRTNSMIRAGDVNRDGRADLISLTDGLAYVVFGQSNWSPGTVRDAGGLKADINFTIGGAYDEGESAEVADFDGDSFPDLLLHEGYSQRTWIVRSRTSFPANLYMNLATYPELADIFYPSHGMDAAGDINGDGRADLISPAWEDYNNYGGKAYLVFTLPAVKTASILPTPLNYGTTASIGNFSSRMTTSIGYQWLRNGSPITGATKTSLPPSNFIAGDRIGCRLSPSMYGSAGQPYTATEVVVQPYAGPLPDLRIENVRFYPEILNPSETIRFTGRVTNGGGARGGPFWIEFLAKPFRGSGQTIYLCPSIAVESLDAGASLDLSLFPRVVHSIPHDIYLVGIRVDPLNQVIEGDETNNLRWLTDTLLDVGHVLGVQRWTNYR